MPKTKLCKANKIKASLTPLMEIKAMIKGSIAGKFTVGILRFLETSRGIKLPNDKKKKDAWDDYKPYGDLIEALYNITKEVSMHTRIGVPFNSPGKWFEACLIDCIHFERNIGFSGKNACVAWGELRTELLTYESFDLLSLNNYFADKGLQALALLFDYCVASAKKNYRFEQDYWKPFLAALLGISKISQRKNVEVFTFDVKGKVTYQRKKARIVSGYLPEVTQELISSFYVNG